MKRATACARRARSPTSRTRWVAIRTRRTRRTDATYGCLGPEVTMRRASILIAALAFSACTEAVAQTPDLLGAVSSATLDAPLLPCTPCTSCSVGLAFELDERRSTRCEEKGP